MTYCGRSTSTVQIYCLILFLFLINTSQSYKVNPHPDWPVFELSSMYCVCNELPVHQVLCLVFNLNLVRVGPDQLELFFSLSMIHQ